MLQYATRWIHRSVWIRIFSVVSIIHFFSQLLHGFALFSPPSFLSRVAVLVVVFIVAIINTVSGDCIENSRWLKNNNNNRIKNMSTFVHCVSVCVCVCAPVGLFVYLWSLLYSINIFTKQNQWHNVNVYPTIIKTT